MLLGFKLNILSLYLVLGIEENIYCEILKFIKQFTFENNFVSPVNEIGTSFLLNKD